MYHVQCTQHRNTYAKNCTPSVLRYLSNCFDTSHRSSRVDSTCKHQSRKTVNYILLFTLLIHFRNKKMLQYKCIGITWLGMPMILFSQSTPPRGEGTKLIKISTVEDSGGKCARLWSPHNCMKFQQVLIGSLNRWIVLN